jgi:hypothetical protein
MGTGRHSDFSGQRTRLWRCIRSVRAVEYNITKMQLGSPGNNTHAQMRNELRAALEQARQACSLVNTAPCTAQPH